MAMSWVWTGMVALSLVFGIATGNLDAVASAAMEGAGSAVELGLAMAGVLCLWSGVMEVMDACGISGALAKAFRPLLRRLLKEGLLTSVWRESTEGLPSRKYYTITDTGRAYLAAMEAEWNNLLSAVSEMKGD